MLFSPQKLPQIGYIEGARRTKPYMLNRAELQHILREGVKRIGLTDRLSTQ